MLRLAMASGTGEEMATLLFFRHDLQRYSRPADAVRGSKEKRI